MTAWACFKNRHQYSWPANTALVPFFFFGLIQSHMLHIPAEMKVWNAPSSYDACLSSLQERNATFKDAVKEGSV